MGCTEKYFDEDGKLKERDCHTSAPASSGGAGTELKALLASVGITAKPGCKCNRRAAEMDRLGVDWCRQNIETIVDWLQEEAYSRHLPFIRAAARLLVKRAIAKADNGQ